MKQAPSLRSGRSGRAAGALLALLATAGSAQGTSVVLLNSPVGGRAAFYAGIGLVPLQFETFETLPIPHDTSVAGFWQNGVTYNALTSSPLVVASAGALGQFAPSLMPTTSSVLTGNGFDTMEIRFDQPVQAVTLDFYTNGRGLTKVSFFNDAQFVAFVSRDQEPEIRSAGYWSDDMPINRIVFENTLGEIVNGGIDNLDWVAAQVPEPATWALWGTGLLGLARLRRHGAPR